MLTIQQIELIVQNTHPDDTFAGCDCRWIDISLHTDKPMGVKMFPTEEVFNHCYEWHERAAADGYGPRIYDVFETVYNGDHYYCVLMESILVAYDLVGTLTSDQLGKLENKLARIVEVEDIIDYDLHRGNWGIRSLRSRTPLVIDFSRFPDEFGNITQWGEEYECIEMDKF